MRCPTCGRKNSKKARFCIECGGPLPAGSRPGPSSPVVLIALVGAIAVVLVLIFVALLTLLAGEEDPVPGATAPSAVVGTARSVAAGEAPVVTVVVGSNSPTSLPISTSGQDVEPSATATMRPTLSPIPTSLPPTRSPSSTPTITPVPTDPPAPTKPPAPTCRKARKGWIGFKRQKRCNKQTGDACGPVEIWVMKADGSKQAPMCDTSVYHWGLTRDRTSPDGQWRVEVTSGRGGTEIMRVYTDGRQELIIVNNGMDWDPVLSADGWWLAWVTNRNANDEIYIKTMDPFDQHQRRLTVNDWEWDKHPSWSPDGGKIAFYSNRANQLNEATRQIWVMDVVNDQGVNLRNVSNRPNKVDTDPVWFKWDDMP